MVTNIFDRNKVIEELKEVNTRLEKERSKDVIDNELERQLMMEMLIKGLKLNTLGRMPF